MPPLKNPVRDATEVEATLKRLGFLPTKLINADAAVSTKTRPQALPRAWVSEEELATSLTWVSALSCLHTLPQ